MKVRFRLTLRLLLGTLTVLCLALGWWTSRAREQLRIVHAIKRSEHGRFYYDYQFKHEAFELPGQNSNLPKRLFALLGQDYFHSVTFVSVHNRELLSDISKLPWVEELEINDPRLTDQDLIPITRMQNLKELTVNWPWHPQWPTTQSVISDKTLRHIQRMPRIQDVQIAGHGITREGLLELTKSRTLEHGHFWGCVLSGEKLPFEIPRGSQVFVVEHDTANGTTAPYATQIDLKR